MLHRDHAPPTPNRLVVNGREVTGGFLQQQEVSDLFGIKYGNWPFFLDGFQSAGGHRLVELELAHEGAFVSAQATYQEGDQEDTQWRVAFRIPRPESPPETFASINPVDADRLPIDYLNQEGGRGVLQNFSMLLAFLGVPGLETTTKKPLHFLRLGFDLAPDSLAPARGDAMRSIQKLISDPQTPDPLQNNLVEVLGQVETATHGWQFPIVSLFSEEAKARFPLAYLTGPLPVGLLLHEDNPALALLFRRYPEWRLFDDEVARDFWGQISNPAEVALDSEGHGRLLALALGHFLVHGLVGTDDRQPLGEQVEAFHHLSQGEQATASFRGGIPHLDAVIDLIGTQWDGNPFSPLLHAFVFQWTKSHPSKGDQGFLTDRILPTVVTPELIERYGETTAVAQRRQGRTGSAMIFAELRRADYAQIFAPLLKGSSTPTASLINLLDWGVAQPLLDQLAEETAGGNWRNAIEVLGLLGGCGVVGAVNILGEIGDQKEFSLTDEQRHFLTGPLARALTRREQDRPDAAFRAAEAITHRWFAEGGSQAVMATLATGFAAGDDVSDPQFWIELRRRQIGDSPDGKDKKKP